MANYNTFVVVDCKKRKPILVTSSARKASERLAKGFRIEVWNNNSLLEVIHESDKQRELCPMQPFVEQEKEYIRQKQKRHEERNARRKKGA